MGKTLERKTSPSTGKPKRQVRVEKSVGRASRGEEEEEVERVATEVLVASPSHGSESVSRGSGNKSSPKKKSPKSSRKASKKQRSPKENVSETQSRENDELPHEYPDTVPSTVCEEKQGLAQSAIIDAPSPMEIKEEEGETFQQVGKGRRSKSWPPLTGKRKSMEEKADEEEKETDPSFFPEDCIFQGEIDFSSRAVDQTFSNPPARKRTTYEHDWILAKPEADKPVEEEAVIEDAVTKEASSDKVLKSKAVYRDHKKTPTEETKPQSPKSAVMDGGKLRPLLREVEDLPRDAILPPLTAEREVLYTKLFEKPLPLRRQVAPDTGSLPTIESGKKLLASSLKEPEVELCVTQAKPKRSSYGEDRMPTPYPASKVAHRSKQLKLNQGEKNVESILSNNPPTAEREVSNAESFEKPLPLRRQVTRDTGSLPTIESGKKLLVPSLKEVPGAELYVTPAKPKRSSYGEDRMPTPYPASKVAHRSKHLKPDEDKKDADPVLSNKPPTTEREVSNAESFEKPLPLRRQVTRDTGSLPTIESGKKLLLPSLKEVPGAELYVTPAKPKRSSYGEDRMPTPYPASKVAHRSKHLKPDEDKKDADPVPSNNPPPPSSSSHQ